MTKDCFAWHSSLRIAPPTERLRADLGRLDSTPARVPDLAWLLPPFETPAAALGCAWVIEGSALGARVLSRSLMRSLEIGPENGGAFFATQPRQQERWQACCAEIEACGQYPGQCKLMIAAAKAVFDAFLFWLDGTVRDADEFLEIA
jgi:heme oxygenase